MKVIIVAGPPRSGTTWLLRELTQAQNCYPFLPECSTITSQIKLYYESRYLEPNRYQAYYGTPSDCRTFFQSIVSEAINRVKKLSKATNSEILFLKDPEMSIYLQEVCEVIPMCELAIIIRDPRDVIASMKQVENRAGKIFNLDKVIEDIYNYYYRILIARNAGTPMKVRRYEDLIRYGLRNFFQDLNLKEASKHSKSFSTNEQLALDKSSPFFSPLYLESTTSSRIGQHKKDLSELETSKVEAVFSGIMAEFDYK